MVGAVGIEKPTAVAEYYILSDVNVRSQVVAQVR